MMCDRCLWEGRFVSDCKDHTEVEKTETKKAEKPSKEKK